MLLLLYKYWRQSHLARMNLLLNSYAQVREEWICVVARIVSEIRPFGAGKWLMLSVTPHLNVCIFFCSFRFSFFYHLFWWTGLTSKRIQLFSQSTFSFLQMPNNWSWWESEHEMTHLFRGIIHRYHYECCVLCLFWRSIVVYWHSFSSVIIAYDE